MGKAAPGQDHLRGTFWCMWEFVVIVVRLSEFDVFNNKSIVYILFQSVYKLSQCFHLSENVFTLSERVLLHMIVCLFSLSETGLTMSSDWERFYLIHQVYYHVWTLRVVLPCLKVPVPCLRVFPPCLRTVLPCLKTESISIFYEIV